MNSVAIVLAKLNGIAQTGKHYSKDVYDQERYEELQILTAALIQELSNDSMESIQKFLTHDTGYATPKTDVRALVLNQHQQILMVQEKSDHCWALPGGWSDIGYSPKEIAEKEVQEEAGIQVKAERLLAVLDKNKHPFPSDIFYTYKMIILCKIVSGTLKQGIETEAVSFFLLMN